jgi:hypothetical protein
MMLTLIAYKPDGSCISMGHVVENYSSEFELHHCETVEKLAQHYVRIEAHKPDVQEPPYEIHVLVSGVPLERQSDTMRISINRAIESAREVFLAEQKRKDEEATAQAEAAAKALAETQRQRELDQFFAQGKKLGYNVVPSQDC